MGKFVTEKPSLATPARRAHAPGDPITTLYPALSEYLTEAVYSDGSPRTTSSVSIFMGANGLQGCINDKDALRVAFVSSDTVEGVLDVLEAGLEGCTLDWRAARPGGRKK